MITAHCALRLLSQTIAIGAALFNLAMMPVWSEEFVGPVVGVSDGDTITVLHSGRPERVRLQGIDCPEKRQPFGNRARHYCSSLAFGQNVRVIVLSSDRYGRSVAEVVLPDQRSLNKELVANGMAWWYRKYSRDPVLAALEQNARRSGLGLWADAGAMPPWSFRAFSKHLELKNSPILVHAPQR